MKRVSVLFKNYNSGKVWTKSFRSKTTAKRAVKGILSRGNNWVKDSRSGFSSDSNRIQFEKSKGMKYGSMIKRYNRNNY